MPDETQDFDPLRLDNQFCFVLYALSRKVTQMYRPVLEPLGLTYPQYLVMLVLWEAQRNAGRDFNGLTVGAIGEYLLLDSGTLTPLLKRLATQGLILRQRSQSDEREVRVVLTEQGLSLREQARGVPMHLLQQSGFAPDQVLAVQRTLLSMLRQL